MAEKKSGPDEVPVNPYLAVPPIEPAPKAAPRKAAAPKAPAAEAPAVKAQPTRPDPYEQAPAEEPAAAASTAPVPPANPYIQSTPTNPYAPSYAGTPPQGLSIASFVLGIASVVMCCFGGVLFAIPAVILGHLGQRNQPRARGFWLTGLILGYIGVALGLLSIVYYIALFAMSASSSGY